MPSNPSNKQQPQEPQPQQPLNPADFEVQSGPIPLQPKRKPAGKPTVNNKLAKPKIGAVQKVKPTFGSVRGVYN